VTEAPGTVAPDSVPLDILRDGELTVRGRITDASNATLYCTAEVASAPSADGGAPAEAAQLECVYKPIAGERPLWDFPDGTLAAREFAAFEVSTALGWGVVPRTVLRDGPYGPGMCQRWIETVDHPQVLAVFPGAAVPGEWFPVIGVQLADGRDGVLAHRDDAELRRIALFDAVINNADRKGGHLLPGTDGRLYAIDHGISFHTEDKLRTLLWGFADSELSAAERADLERLRADRGLADELTGLLTEEEAAAFHARIDTLLGHGCFPSPKGRQRPIPWPPV
jgi:uncharacterized repeat protein (TIGR03843 family)